MVFTSLHTCELVFPFISDIHRSNPVQLIFTITLVASFLLVAPFSAFVPACYGRLRGPLCFPTRLKYKKEGL